MDNTRVEASTRSSRVAGTTVAMGASINPQDGSRRAFDLNDRLIGRVLEVIAISHILHVSAWVS